MQTGRSQKLTDSEQTAGLEFLRSVAQEIVHENQHPSLRTTYKRIAFQPSVDDRSVSHTLNPTNEILGKCGETRGILGGDGGGFAHACKAPGGRRVIWYFSYQATQSSGAL